jgi:NAD(P)-dependent dehydrogenase (short-subunit alcohol dehydrogenase family)
MKTDQHQTIFITGVSTGLGRAFAEAALAAGHRVVGTVRKENARADFEALSPGRAFAKLLDVTDEAAVSRVVSEIEKDIGAVDVLIHNAGYGHEGILEESSMSDLRNQFEVNVFGAVSVIKAVLPYMRVRRSGRIIAITSMGGIVTFPGLCVYHGSKFALEGLLEALGKEVADFGIHVTAVEPGAFRTDWAGRSMVRAPRSIPDYDALIDPIRERRNDFSGRQPGDPAKAAEAILKLIASEAPPAHLLLGSDAVRVVREKLAQLGGEIDAWEHVSKSTEFA